MSDTQPNIEVSTVPPVPGANAPAMPDTGAPASLKPTRKAPEPTYEILHAGVSGKQNGKDVDFYMGSIVPASALSAVHEDLDALVEAGAIKPA